MLVAIISLCAPSDEEDNLPRGLLRFAGQTIAERQIDLAMELGCERVVCLVDRIDHEVIALQDTAKDAGAKFNAVTGGLSLLGQVTAGDEVLVFADGIMPQADVVERHLGEKSGVLVIPADGSVEIGYERIDAEWAWAGVLRGRGSLVESLSQLPPDVDPVSALLRIALQRGTRVVPLDGSKAKRTGWLLATNEDVLVEFENEFLRRHAPRASYMRPVRAIADRIALKLAGPIVDRGGSGIVPLVVGTLIGVGGVIAGYFEYPLAGLGMLGLGAFVADIGTTLLQTLTAIRQKKTNSKSLTVASSVLFELAMVGLVVMAGNRAPMLDYGFLALLLIGLLVFVRLGSESRWSEPLRDRTLVFVFVGLAAALDVLKPALALSSLALVALLLAVQRRNKLTSA